MIKADAKFCRFCRKDISKAGNFKVKCPRCAETFELDYGSDCRKVNCPFCGHNFQAVSEKQENWSSASNGLYISLLTLGMTVLSAWFVAVACMIAGIVYSVIALFKFHDHPDKKYKEYAEWGIVANIFAFCIGIAIKMVISSL